MYKTIYSIFNWPSVMCKSCSSNSSSLVSQITPVNYVYLTIVHLQYHNIDVRVHRKKSKHIPTQKVCNHCMAAPLSRQKMMAKHRQFGATDGKHQAASHQCFQPPGGQPLTPVVTSMYSLSHQRFQLINLHVHVRSRWYFKALNVEKYSQIRTYKQGI